MGNEASTGAEGHTNFIAVDIPTVTTSAPQQPAEDVKQGTDIGGNEESTTSFASEESIEITESEHPEQRYAVYISVVPRPQEAKQQITPPCRRHSISQPKEIGLMVMESPFTASGSAGSFNSNKPKRGGLFRRRNKGRKSFEAAAIVTKTSSASMSTEDEEKKDQEPEGKVAGIVVVSDEEGSITEVIEGEFSSGGIITEGEKPNKPALAPLTRMTKDIMKANSPTLQPQQKDFPLSPVIERSDSQTSGNSTSSNVVSALLSIMEPHPNDDKENEDTTQDNIGLQSPWKNLPQTRTDILDNDEDEEEDDESAKEDMCEISSQMQQIALFPEQSVLPESDVMRPDTPIEAQGDIPTTTQAEAPRQDDSEQTLDDKVIDTFIEAEIAVDSVSPLAFSEADSAVQPSYKSVYTPQKVIMCEADNAPSPTKAETVDDLAAALASPEEDSTVDVADSFSPLTQSPPTQIKQPAEQHHLHQLLEDVDEDDRNPITPDDTKSQAAPVRSPDGITVSPPRFRQQLQGYSPCLPLPTSITAPALNPSPVPSPKFGKAWGEQVLDTPPANVTVATAASSTASNASSMAMAALAMANPGAARIRKNKSTADVIRTDIWSRDPTVVFSALRHIQADCASEKSRGLIARTGGLLAVVRAMETHSTEPRIQVSGCQALEKLALDTDNEVAIEQVGGIDVIFSAMMGHFSNVKVQEAAWSALWNLTCTNARREMTLDNEGCMERLVAAMQEHMDSPAVQKNACGAMANLCGNSPHRMEAFAKADGFMVLSTALTRYWNSDPEVRSEACFAMTALCEANATTSRATTLVAALPLPSMATRSSSNAVSDNGARDDVSIASSTKRRYLPRRFGGNNLPPSVLNMGSSAGRSRNQHHHQQHHYHHTSSQDNSDLQSLASISYFEEETIFDDRSLMTGM